MVERVEIGKHDATGCPKRVYYSSGTRWPGLVLDRGGASSGELPEGYLRWHAIMFVIKPPSHHDFYLPDRGWHKHPPYANTVQFFPAGTLYASRWSGDCECLLLGISPDFVSWVCGPTPQSRSLPSTYVNIRNPLLIQLMLSLDGEVVAGPRRNFLYGESLGTAIVAELLNQRNIAPESGHRGAERLDLVLEYIQDNIAADLSLATLASMADIGVERLLKLFKGRTGYSLHQYVLRQRVTIARKLMSNRSASIAEVALSVGFQDQSNFCKAFRRITGVSPREYQRASQL